jgi:Ca2+ transporting ATPase
MVFSGTTVSGGRARCIVVDTGVSTEIGKISKAVSEEEDEKSPLKKKLDQFSEQVGAPLASLASLAPLASLATLGTLANLNALASLAFLASITTTNRN